MSDAGKRLIGAAQEAAEILEGREIERSKALLSPTTEDLIKEWDALIEREAEDGR